MFIVKTRSLTGHRLCVTLHHAKNLLIIAAIAAAATAMPSAAAATEVQEIKSVKGNMDVLPEKVTNDMAAKLVVHDTDYKTGVMTVHIYEKTLML